MAAILKIHLPMFFFVINLYLKTTYPDHVSIGHCQDVCGWMHLRVTPARNFFICSFSNNAKT